MPDIYKPLLNITADWFTTIMRRRLQQKRRATRMQAQTLPRLVRQLAHTERGQQLGITADMSAAAWRQNVPLSTHRELAPWVEKTKAGQANQLWPGTCDCFAATAGTVTGQPRLVPVTREMQAAYGRSCRDAILHATARAGTVHALLRRVLLLAGNVPTNELEEHHHSAVADLGTLAAVQHPEWISQYYYEPSSRIALRTDWDDYVRRILKRLRKEKLSMIAGHPQWLLDFTRQITRELAKGKLRYTSLRSIWPSLRVVGITGDFMVTIHRQLRRAAGEGVMLHEVFAMAEGLVAAQGPGAIPGLRLLAESGMYFEFLPLEDYARSDLAERGVKAVPLNLVQNNRDYLLVMTTPAGLVRHLPGDVVRFTSVTPPRILPMGQVELRLNSFGENVLPRDAVTLLHEICRHHNWTITQFHVAPLIKRSELGQNHGCHEWWIELQPGTVITPTGPVIAQKIDRSMSEHLPSYRNRRDNGNLRMPVVRLVMPGAFEHWLRHTGKWGGPHKLPPTRDDRQIADSLSRMARFSKD